MSVPLFFINAAAFDVSCKLRELRSAILDLENRKTRVSVIMLGRGSEVMFWEPQNSSLHHEVGEILLPMVAETEYTNCNHCNYALNFVILFCIYVKICFLFWLLGYKNIFLVLK